MDVYTGMRRHDHVLEDCLADYDTITAFVMKFAGDTQIFVTPLGIRDPIHPALTSFPDDQFHAIYFSLLSDMAEANIIAAVPMEGFRACKIWRDVATLILHNQ
jgi:hypothetical protein